MKTKVFKTGVSLILIFSSIQSFGQCTCPFTGGPFSNILTANPWTTSWQYITVYPYNSFAIFTVQNGSTYEWSFCAPNANVTSGYDPRLNLYHCPATPCSGSGSNVQNITCNGDYCGLLPRIQWTATANQDVWLVVDLYVNASNPCQFDNSVSFTLGFRRVTPPPPNNCVASLISPSSDGSGPNAFSGDFIFTATQPGCTFTITPSGCSFVSVTDPSSLTGIANQGGGNQYIIAYSVQANSTTSSRVCTLTVGGLTFTITQGPCDPGFDRSTINNVSAAGATITNTGVDADNAPCAWSIQNGCNWVSVDKSSGTGDYDLTITVQQNPNCSTRSCTLSIGNNDLVINQNAGSSTLAVAISPSNPTFCSGESVQLIASGANSYNWSNGSSGSTITVNSAGSYSVTGTDANSCTGTTSVNVIQSPTLNISITPSINPIIINSGESVQFCASGASAYIWSNGSSGSCITVAAGSYTVTGTSGGCSGTASTNVVVGIEDITSIAKLTIYPNPNSGSFMVQFEIRSEEEIQISVVNILGQSVYKSTPEKIAGKYSKSIELSGVASGVYFVRVQVGKNFINQKIIVQ